MPCEFHSLSLSLSVDRDRVEFTRSLPERLKVMRQEFKDS